jgi:hypothetical protein
MTERYTRKDIQNCGRRLAQAVGHEFGDEKSGCYEKTAEGRFKSKEGCLRVDYNPTYGGSIIEQIVGEAGGVTHPFGEGRLKGYEFCRATRYGEGAVELFKKRKGP